jgi:L-threonylcarbamoyladenylate synthase
VAIVPVSVDELSETGFSQEVFETVAHALDSGSIVAVPTETGYGLCADVSYTGAADKLFAVKRRSREFELPMVVTDAEQALSLAVGVPEAAETLMATFWPGPLTLVLPRHPDFVADLGSDDETVGVRCPDHVVPRLVCEEVGPLAITSANMSGQPTLHTAAAVQEIFGEAVSLVLDAGETSLRQATVVDCTGAEPKLLREGDLSWKEILDLL